MLLHTWTFAAFAVLALIGHLLLRRGPAGPAFLLAVSYVFYGAWNPLFLLLILGSTVVDWVIAARIDKAQGATRKLWLLASVAINLSLLGFFKYAGFVTDNLNVLLASTGYQLPQADLLLPVGISFFTFQSMSYTIDVYRRQLAPEPDFFRFAAFVALFPQLVAGPIERARNLLPQLREHRSIDRNDLAAGASLFVIGLFKKIALADYLSLYTDLVYDAPHAHDAPALLLATFCFGWQIYFDFSGYTDMARGIARVFGFRLMRNFAHPYTATDLGDFWRRWHISLSTWFRDYVYRPLGGSRHGAVRTTCAIALTMLLSGLWHGAAWGFVIWGALHALGRIATRPLERSTFYRQRVPRVCKQALVFGFVTFCWLFFRAQSWERSWTVLERIGTTSWTDPRCPLLMLAMITAVWSWQLLQRTDDNGEVIAHRVLHSAPVRIAVFSAMFVWLLLVARPALQPFLYFQF